jgi:hypothetical protein
MGDLTSVNGRGLKCIPRACPAKWASVWLGEEHLPELTSKNRVSLEAQVNIYTYHLLTFGNKMAIEATEACRMKT